jgi:hypothetical protein
MKVQRSSPSQSMGTTIKAADPENEGALWKRWNYLERIATIHRCSAA